MKARNVIEGTFTEKNVNYIYTKQCLDFTESVAGVLMINTQKKQLWGIRCRNNHDRFVDGSLRIHSFIALRGDTTQATAMAEFDHYLCLVAAPKCDLLIDKRCSRRFSSTQLRDCSTHLLSFSHQYRQVNANTTAVTPAAGHERHELALSPLV